MQNNPMNTGDFTSMLSIRRLIAHFCTNVNSTKTAQQAQLQIAKQHAISLDLRRINMYVLL